MSTITAETLGKELATELHADYNAGLFEARNFKPEFDKRLDEAISSRDDLPNDAEFLYWRISVYDACLTELRALQERARAA